MADHPSYHSTEDPMQARFYKFNFEIEEPTSVLELVYDSSSPQLNSSIDTLDQSDIPILSDFPSEEDTVEALLQDFKFTPITFAPFLVEGLGNLLSEDVEINRAAVIKNSSVSVPMLEEADDFFYDDGTDLYHFLVKTNWQELPVLSSDKALVQTIIDQVRTSHDSAPILAPAFPDQLCHPVDPQICNSELLVQFLGSWLVDQLGDASIFPVQLQENSAFPFSRSHPRSEGHTSTRESKQDSPPSKKRKLFKAEQILMIPPCSEEYTTRVNSGMKLQLLDKLVACAQAVACHDNRQAKLILEQIKPMTSPYGDSLQRIACFFVEALRSRIHASGCSALQLSDTQMEEGFELMYEECPFIPFGHFATNSMILEAVEGEKVIHIVDLGTESTLQWPGFIQSLAHRSSGRPNLLRITAVGVSSERMNEGRHQLEMTAKSVDLRFEFRAILVQSMENMKNLVLDLRQGEALVVNSILQLHTLLKESRGGGLCSLLQWIRDLSPKIMTLVEQDTNHNGPLFLGRFREALHYYCAIFESLDITMPKSSIKRAKIEQFYYRQQINNILSCEGSSRVERHERLDQWRRRMGRAGFQPLPFSLLSLKARIWLARYDDCDQYTLIEEKGSLVLGWRGKSILGASAWRC